MPEKTKRDERAEENKPEKPCADKKEISEPSDWSRDQTEKSYYYDDAHGYEIYNPEDDDEDD